MLDQRRPAIRLLVQPVTSWVSAPRHQSATELLLATTTFTAKTVPLLRGCIVAATHDADGDLDGLSWQQLDLLTERNRSLTRRDERILDRRVLREDRRRRRTAEIHRGAPVRGHARIAA
jgi:hypothetical protein